MLTVLEALSNFFGMFASVADVISAGWGFLQGMADFFTWLIEFVSELFG